MVTSVKNEVALSVAYEMSDTVRGHSIRLRVPRGGFPWVAVSLVLYESVYLVVRDELKDQIR